jgi:hypothetical protein
MIKNVLSTSSYEEVSKENTANVIADNELDKKQFEKISDDHQIDKINYSDFDSNNVVSTADQPSSSCENYKRIDCVLENDEIKLLFRLQSELITEIKKNFNRTRENSNWKDFEEHLNFIKLYKEFVSLSKDIYDYTDLSYTLIINRFDYTIIDIEEHMSRFDVIEASIKKNIKKTRSNLLMNVFLKRTLTNAHDFYSKIDQTYQIQLTNYDNICKSICSSKTVFKNTILHMKNIEKIILISKFDFIQGRVKILFTYFDENNKSSFFRVHESIKRLSKSYLEKLNGINKEVYRFFSKQKIE